jgi:GntR family transcriptional regulator
MWAIRIDGGSAVPIYEQIAEQIRGLVRTGRAAPGARLPSVRELAARLGVNPLTVAKGYLALEREGFLVSQAGRGTFVAPSPPRMAEAERRRELARRVRAFVQESGWLIRSAGELREMIRSQAIRLQ